MIFHLTVIVLLLIHQLDVAKQKKTDFLFDFSRQEEIERQIKEQEELLEKIEQYESEKNSGKEQLANIQDFIDEVSEYAGITELNFKILHQLIDKILIFSAEEIDGEKVQKIQIHYKFIGALGMIE